MIVFLQNDKTRGCRGESNNDYGVEYAGADSEED
jgi:hypothetical protein